MYKKVEFKNKLADNIKKFRLERGLSQKGLSEGICEQSQISNLERGETMPTVYVMYNICKKLDISMEMLVEESMSEYMYKLEEFKAYAKQLIKNNEYVKLEEEIGKEKNYRMLSDFGNDGASVYILCKLKVIYFKIRNKTNNREDIDYLKKQYKILIETKIHISDLVKMDVVITLNRIFIELGKKKETQELLKITNNFLEKGSKIFHAEFFIRNDINKIIIDILEESLDSAKIKIEYLSKEVEKGIDAELVIDFYGLQGFFYSRIPGHENKMLTRMYLEKALSAAEIINNQFKINHYKIGISSLIT